MALKQDRHNSVDGPPAVRRRIVAFLSILLTGVFTVSLIRLLSQTGVHGWAPWLLCLAALLLAVLVAVLASWIQRERLAYLRSECRFRSIFDQAAAGILMIDDDGIPRMVNARASTLLGYSAEELSRINVEVLTLPEDRPARAARLAKLKAGEVASYSLERRCVRKDGSVFWAELHHRWVAATEDLSAHSVLVMLDIDERRQAEQFAEEARRLRDFQFEQTPLAMIEWTPSLQMKRWSRQAETMFGWTEADVRGLNPFEWGFVQKDHYAESQKIAQRLMDGSIDQVSHLVQNHRKDGGCGWYHWHHAALRDAEGRLQSIHSMGSDARELHQAMQALEDSESELRAIFEQAAVGVSVLNADGSWKKVNQRLCTIVGYTAEELLATDYQTLTLPEDLLKDLDRARQLIDGEIDSYEIEKRYVHKQGHIIWVKVFASRIDATPMRPPLYVAVIEDIGDRRRIETELQQLAADLERQVFDRTRALHDTIRHAGERSSALGLMAEMMIVLPAARDMTEATQILASFLPRLFRRYVGAVWLEDGTAAGFSRISQWGGQTQVVETIRVDDCWALRRGQALRVEDPADPLHCPHLGDTALQPQEPHTCIPVTALGDTVGLIHLGWSEHVGSAALPPDAGLLASAAEQIGLAIGNIRLRNKLRQQALRDVLTGLCNRRHLEETLQQYFARLRQARQGFSLLLLDIDHFKAVNDTYGHEAGDETLQQVAGVIRQFACSDEDAFRLGGEEFVLLVKDAQPQLALACAERLRSDIQKIRMVRGGRELPVITVSIGVACCLAHEADDNLERDRLLRRADAALYAAKRTGRNRVCLADAVPGQVTVAIAAVPGAGSSAPIAMDARA